jgi:thiamine-phosphate pyrophosphorylase
LLLYYITDRKQLPGGGSEQQRRLAQKIGEAARAGVDYIQLREKDLASRVLEQLAREAVRAVRQNSSTTKLLINSRVDVALAVGADGVHLTSADISASDARSIVSHPASGVQQRANSQFVIAVSTHTLNDVESAFAHGADFVAFGPVFAKVSAPAREGVGLEQLRTACVRAKQVVHAERAFGVFALGGVTVQNTPACVEAGVAGIAAIRLFQEQDVSEVVRELKSAAD